jgi:glycerol-3-phosphate dehydrogenase subunit C
MLGVNLLRLIPGLELEIVDGCCGQSGTYGYKVENKGVSMAISRTLAQQLTAINPSIIITPCGSCKYRISFVSGIKTLHPVQILKAAVD